MHVQRRERNDGALRERVFGMIVHFLEHMNALYLERNNGVVRESAFRIVF